MEDNQQPMREVRMHIIFKLPHRLDTEYVEALAEQILELLPTGSGQIDVDIMGE